jgi:hypothetical protein
MSGDDWRERLVNKRRDLCSRDVTLDGRRAVLSGARLPFAVVAALDGGGVVPFSWDAVERVLRSGGAFRST